MTLSLHSFCRRIGPMLVFVFCSVAGFAEVGSSPVTDLRLAGRADEARVIVKFRSDSVLLRKHALAAAADARQTLDAVSARANALGARFGLSLRAGRAINELTQVVGASGISSTALAAHLAAEADVEYAVVDQRRRHFAVPNDPLYAQGPPIVGSSGGPAVGQWYLRAPAGEVVSSINATGAWDQTTGSSNVVVAVLDTGVRRDHPDLTGRLLSGYDMITDLSIANDGTGRDTDSSDPGDWVTSTESASRSGLFYQCDVEDSSWHGTKTASLIGASSNNGFGMTGVAWGANLLPVRVLGKCGGYDSDIIAGMRWAAGLSVPGVPANSTPAQVINLSLGGSGACTLSYIDAISAIVNKSNPAVIVVAAGNSAGLAIGSPGNCPGVISVAGLRHIGTKVGFSDLGPEISISAPGGNCVNTGAAEPCLYPILAATNTGTKSPLTSTYTDSFDYSVGTSFSAPLVAGTAALMLSVQPTLTPDQIRTALQSTARAFPRRPTASESTPDCRAPDTIEQLECYCTTTTCGAGMLDAAAAVAAVTPNRVPTAAPAVYPQTGWWWNPAESGRGYSIEVSGNLLFLAAYLYDASGRASWAISAGALNADGSYSGQLQQYGGGQSLTGGYNPPTARASPGNVALACSTPTACNLTWPGGTVPIQRLIWDGSAAPAGSPETGWWWNSAESGRGYFLEQQGSTLFVAGYMYDLAGDDIWYIGSGATAAGVFSSNWSQYGNGQTLTGTYQAPTLVSGNVGALRIELSGSSVGLLTFPDGRTVPITRYRF